MSGPCIAFSRPLSFGGPSLREEATNRATYFRWDEDAITQRGREMFDIALRLWAGPVKA